MGDTWEIHGRYRADLEELDELRDLLQVGEQLGVVLARRIAALALLDLVRLDGRELQREQPPLELASRDLVAARLRLLQARLALLEPRLALGEQRRQRIPLSLRVAW